MSPDPAAQPTSLEYEQQMTKKVLRKLDLHVLPPLAVLWLANFIDRSNIGNARVAGLEDDLHLVGTQFNIILAVFYVPYLLIELPSNILLKKVGPNLWIPLLVCMWGMITVLTSRVQSFNGLLAVRLCLGLCEGGLLPGMVLYLSSLYKRHELQLRVGIFFASASLSGAFGGLLATAIINLNGVSGIQGWRWIFMLEGSWTILAGLVSMFILPKSLEAARFFTEEERLFAVRRFKLDSALPTSTPASLSSFEKGKDDVRMVETVSPTPTAQPQAEEGFEWRELIRGVTEIQVWLTGFAYFGLIVSLYSYSLFLPTIITGLGYSGSAAQLHSVPPYIPAVFITVILAFLGDRFKRRAPLILMCLPLAIIGYIIEICAKTHSVRYAGVFFIAAGVYPSVPGLLTILPNNTGGHFKKATATAIQLAIANAGGFVATFIYTPGQAPEYIRGHTIALAFLCAAWLLVAANVAYCMWENKARADGKRQGNIQKYNELVAAGKTRAPIGDRHPDFRFTL